jgi:uncharacterized membrane protein
MHGAFAAATEATVLAIDAMALVIIAFGTIGAFVEGLRKALSPVATMEERRSVWTRYGHWLVAALTFLLAADIVETMVAPTWDDIGRLAAIAAIRTFLNFFLEQDLHEAPQTKVTNIP